MVIYAGGGGYYTSYAVRLKPLKYGKKNQNFSVVNKASTYLILLAIIVLFDYRKCVNTGNHFYSTSPCAKSKK